MRFWDKTIIAFRSIINNKSRSILTVIIIFIVSTLIMAIMMIALNFAYNSYRVSEESIRTGSSYIYFNRYEKDNYRNGDNTLFSKNEMLDIVDVIKDNPYMVSEINIEGYNEQTFFIPDNNKKMTRTEFTNYHYYPYSINKSITSFNIPFGVTNGVIDGRIWNESDVNTNHIWVSDNFIYNAFSNGVILNIGSKIWIQNYLHEYYEQEVVKFYSVEFEIKGIISSDSITAHNKMLRETYPNSYHSINAGNDIYCDISYLSNLEESFLYIRNFTLTYFPPTTSYNFNQLYSKLEVMFNDLEGIVRTTGNIKTTMYSTIIDEFKIIRIVNAFIIGLAIGLGLFVLFLSIGSVANTIIISVDKNKKFIGLTKALGLKQNAVEDIVRIEATMTIILGVLISSIGVIFAMPLFHKLNSILINSTFSYQLKALKYTIVTQLPFYLPLGVAIIFVLMTLLFSKGSLKTISKMDVITIISEVS